MSEELTAEVAEVADEIADLERKLAEPAKAIVDPSPATCANCAAYRDGDCRFLPTPVIVAADYWCFQHRRAAHPALCDTPIDSGVLNFSAYTRRVLQRAKLRTVEDLLDSGRTAVTTNTALDRAAIREISAKLREFGIVW